MADYATRQQLADLGTSTEALASIATAKQDAVIAARSRFCDGYLRLVPISIPDGGLTAFTGDLTWAVCQLACYDLIANLGYTTEKGNKDTLRMRHDDAIKWLEMVRDGEAAIPIPPDEEGGNSIAGAPIVVSSDIRGWTPRGL